METLWFVLVAFMLTAYVVLDGFDLGTGAVHFLVGKTEKERALALRAIGPVWDGNEVWLLAAGGALYFAFPALYASSFSGFYLPLTMVLWLLMLRALGVELRGHVDNPMWRSMWDFVFSGASILLAIFFGAALGNVVRGVPLRSDGYFFVPLWTDWQPGPSPGVLDWYTVLTGVMALVVLGTHGANYVALKTEGDVNARARRVGLYGAWAIVALTAVSLAATLYVRPGILANFGARPWGVVLPGLVAVALAAMLWSRTVRIDDLAAFLGSACFIVAMLGGAAFALYPTLLPSSTDPALSLTIHNVAAAPYGLGVGIVWWTIGFVLAVGYFTYLYRSFRGKVSLEGEGY